MSVLMSRAGAVPQYLSLGAGVQSSTLALMAARGEIEMPDAAIFADTQAEPASVYKWLDWLETQLPFPVYRVTAGSLTERITSTRINRKNGNVYYSNMIPAFVLNRDGSKGITGRSCTTNFKIVPINKELRRLIGRKQFAAWRNKHREAVTALTLYKKSKELRKVFPIAFYNECQSDPLVNQWIGISLDEALRMKQSREPWAKHRWPLVERKMSRHDCFRWMEARGYPQPPKSACRYCPFHSDSEWRRQKFEEPEDFLLSVEAEKGVQLVHNFVTTPGKMKGTPFLHESLVPLDQVDFSTDQDHGQQTLFINECEGMCGI